MKQGKRVSGGQQMFAAPTSSGAHAPLYWWQQGFKIFRFLVHFGLYA
jgi:hypothetical protein